MDAATQENRLIALDSSPFDTDVLLLTAFTGEEEMSRLFSYQLELLSAKQDVAAKDIVGKNVTFSIKYGDGETRYFNGIVSRFSASGLNLNDLRLYRAEVVPWLWFLTRTSDCRIFQNKTIPQIIEEIFADLGFSDYEVGEIKGEHPTWDYCVQYRETAFNFISRLAEQEGIFYWFRHEKDKHTLVLADHKDAHQDLPENEVEYVPSGYSSLVSHHISHWDHQYEFLSGRWSQTDYNFEMPSTNLQTSSPTLVPVPDMTKYEVYDYPGEYLKRDDGETLTQLRMEEEETAHDVVNAAGNCRSFSPGGKFTLTRHECPEEKKGYVITSITHSASDTTYAAADDAGEHYHNQFTCIPAEVVFRPARTTPKPVIQGPQTAVVVGPSGEEIYTDRYGRVKIQFHWDRKGGNDENSSCWVRVSYPWAGQGWGGIAIPRIGQEVIVEFLEGDPDRPIITGRVYNAEQMPPYDLPANKTQSGVKSRSSKGGGGANCNEIRFEDKTGAEQLLIHAEKDQTIEVENDESHWVGHDRSKTVDNDETSHIKHNRTETVDNDESITIGNNRSESVGVDESISIGNNRTESVGVDENISIGSNRTESVGANESISVGANRTRDVGQNETVTVALARTHSVGVNEMINVGGAQEVSVGGLQAVTVGATRAVSVGVSQSVNIGTSLSEDVGTNRSENVGDNRSSSVGKDDSLQVGKNLTIDAGDQIVIKTGKASISMKKDGTILIQGKDITIKGSGAINIKANDNVVVKGKKILEN